MALPEEVEKWAIDEVLGVTTGFTGSFKNRKVVYCAKCGKRNIPTDNAPINLWEKKTLKCTKCGTEVRWEEARKYRKLDFTKKISLYRVIDGVQFIFYFTVEMLLQKCRPAKAKFKTIGAVAFNEKNFISIRYPQSPYQKSRFEFGVFPTPLYDDSNYLRWYIVYPKIELLPILKYRGFDTERKSPLWKTITKFSDFVLFAKPEMSSLEIAAKKDDYDYISNIIDGKHDPDALSLFNRAYIIANRHHYIAEDWSLWMDMVMMLSNAEKDIHNPKYVCPPDIRQGHQFAQESYEQKLKREARKQELEYFNNGPFDVFWHARFNPDCNETTLYQYLHDYGYQETEFDRQYNERHQITNRPIIKIFLDYYLDDVIGETITILRVESVSDLVADENGTHHYELREEYRGLDIKLSPDNVVLNPEVIDQADHNIQINDSASHNSTSYNESTFQKLKSRFNGLIFQDDELILRTLDSAAEYCKEAHIMHNCIALMKCYLKTDSIIMSARVDEKPVADVEIRLKDFSIRQCYGPCNKPTPYRERIEALIEANKDKIQERITIEPDYNRN